MIISDLNYLESVTSETEIFGGTGKVFDFKKNIDSKVNSDTNFKANSDVNDIFNKKANIDVKSKVEGNSSTFAFDNEAVGYYSNTQGTFNQIAVAGEGSSQNGTFVAAANPE